MAKRMHVLGLTDMRVDEMRDPFEERTVEVVTAESADDLNFAVTDVAGQSASGWNLFQFPAGTELDVSLRAEDADENATRETKTVTL